MIAVLRPLTSKKNQNKLSCISPSEANLKMHALEQDLTLMKDELSELEAKYGKLEQNTETVHIEVLEQEAQLNEFEDEMEEKPESPSEEEKVEFVAEDTPQVKRSRDTLMQIISEHKEELTKINGLIDKAAENEDFDTAEELTV